MCVLCLCVVCFVSSRRRHTRCALVTGVQTCALPIYTPKASAEAHAKRVLTLLTNWRAPSLTSRPRRSDAELLPLISDHWEATGGRSAQLLRVLRDEVGVACAQGRLARLAAQIRNERGTT